MQYKNVSVLHPREKRDELMLAFFNTDIVGDEYAQIIGNFTAQLAAEHLEDKDMGQGTVISPILRAGAAMSNRLTKRLPEAELTKISMRRNMQTLKPFVFRSELNSIQQPEGKRLILTDPAIATGGSLLQAIHLAKQNGFTEEHISIMAMLGAPEGLAKLTKEHPAIKIHLAGMVDNIRPDGYFNPNVGDFGDRLFGVRKDYTSER